MSYKVLKDGVLVNTVVGSLEFVQGVYPDHEYELIPPAPKPTHKTEFTPRELYNSFTPQEIILAKIHSDPSIVAQAALLAEGRDVIINSADADYQSTVDQFEAAGVITVERAAEYRQGIPLENA